MVRGLLVAEGCKIGRRHVKTLMQRIGIGRYIAVAHDQTRAGTKLPISAARAGDHAAEPGVGDGHYLHRYGRASSTSPWR